MKVSGASGFTLLELLVALAVFAVMSVLTYGGLRQILSLDDGLQIASKRRGYLEAAVTILEQDLRQAVPRSVRDELGDIEPALRAGLVGETLVLTRAALGLPTAIQRTALGRVRYRFENGILYRDTYSDLDRTVESTYRTRRLLAGLSDFSLRFFADDVWSESWPRATGTQDRESLPHGIEITINFAEGLQFRRLLVHHE